jgi:Uma2 family endonuclease
VTTPEPSRSLLIPPALEADEEESPATDPFYYGWRHVERVRDGRLTVELVPLTEDQAWHPQEGDQVTESSQHDRWCSYLRDALLIHLAADPGAVVLSDVRVRWATRKVRPTGPDVIVLLGARRQREEWRTFDVAAEGARPVLVIEILSPKTAERDRTGKKAEYATIGVPQYVLIDPLGPPERPLSLVGYRLVAGEYVEAAPDARGWLSLDEVGLWLGSEAGRPRLYDAAGRPLLDMKEYAARVRELEAEVRRLRGRDPD